MTFTTVLSIIAAIISLISLFVSILNHRNNIQNRLRDKHLELRVKALDIKTKMGKMHMLSDKLKLSNQGELSEKMKKSAELVSNLNMYLSGNLGRNVTEKNLDDSMIKAMGIEREIDSELERIAGIVGQFSRDW